jgi:hypothetical protein
MAQDYKVLQFKKGDFRDNNNNYWCDMALHGVGEPVRIVVKDPTQYHDGMELYGRVEEKTSQAGKQYLRFYREQKDDNQASFTASTSTPPAPSGQPVKKEWQPRDDNAIRAQWAIGQAVSKVELPFTDASYYQSVESVAKKLYAMVETVKDFSTGTQPTPPRGTEAVKEQIAPAASNQDDDADFASLLQRGFEADGIDINDIPF